VSRAYTRACGSRGERGSSEGWGRTSNHLGAIRDRLLTVESALRACETLADDARVFTHSRGRTCAHEPAVCRSRLLGSLLGERAESTHPFLDNHAAVIKISVSKPRTPTAGLVQTQTAKTVHRLRLHEHFAQHVPFPCALYARCCMLQRIICHSPRCCCCSCTCLRPLCKNRLRHLFVTEFTYDSHPAHPQ